MTATNTLQRAGTAAVAALPGILVVEDEAIVAFDFQQRLKRMGYTVTGVAHNGAQAVKIAAETRPELILMDINLGPGMNGVETAMLIQEKQDLPVIYITANSDTDTVNRAAESSPFGYILKPFEDRELQTAIQLGMAKHQVEQRLKESERRFSATLSSIADGVIATDPRGRIEFFNHAAEAITGKHSSGVLGVDLRTAFSLQDDGTADATVETLFNFAPDHPLPGNSHTALLLQGTGCKIPIEYRAAHIHDERGAFRGTVISFSDISARRQAEDNVRRSQEQLRESHLRLTEKHEELQSFYHTVSHELKTPLTSAREFVSLVLEGLAGRVSKTQKEYLGIAQESCDQMRTCINDLLDVTRLKTGKLSAVFKSASVGQLARRLVLRLTPAAKRKRIRMTCTVKAGVPRLLMDETRIAQVISNLLNNALKFTAEGGAVSLTVQPSADPAYVEILVADNGSGIAPEHLPRIFDRLYQVRGPKADSCMGLGLGLFICRELVDLHAGRIEVESKEGEGSRFQVTLPLSPPGGTASAEESALAPK